MKFELFGSYSNNFLLMVDILGHQDILECPRCGHFHCPLYGHFQMSGLEPGQLVVI